jgi:hypothetical protein
VRSLRQSQASAAVRFARTCYDHLAGRVGVALTEALVEAGSLQVVEDRYTITAAGAARLGDFGVELCCLRGPLRFVPHHVDWSERRHHIAGHLAVGLTRRLFDLGWLACTPASRAVRVTEAGQRGLLD